MTYSIRHTTDTNNVEQTEILCSHSNHRGDIIARSDSTGSLTFYAVYEAYGTRPFEWTKPGTSGNPDRQYANTKDEETDLGLLNEGMRYRDLYTGTFLTRDPIGYADGPNIYCYVHNNPVTRFDTKGLYADDMHFLGSYIAMRSARISHDKAIRVAYFAAYPDHSKYEAICSESANNLERAARVHSLTGANLNEVAQLRKRLSRDIQGYMKKKEYASAGFLLHTFGDTYGHLELTKGKPVKRLFNGLLGGKTTRKTGHRTYKLGIKGMRTSLGHLEDFTAPDQVRFRPGLAKDYITDVYKQFGGKDPSKDLKGVYEKIDEIHEKQLNSKESYALLKSYILSNPWGDDPQDLQKRAGQFEREHLKKGALKSGDPLDDDLLKGRKKFENGDIVNDMMRRGYD